MGKGPSLVLRVGVMRPGEVVTLSFRATVNGGLPAGTEILNTAQVSGDDGTRTRTNSASVLLLVTNNQTDLGIQKSVRRVGLNITYTLVVSNGGPNDASGAIVSDTIPVHIRQVFWTCVAAGGADCTRSGSGNTLNDTLSSFPPGGMVTYTIAGKIDIFADETNTAYVIPPEQVTDLNQINNRSTVGMPYKILLVIVLRDHHAAGSMGP